MTTKTLKVLTVDTPNQNGRVYPREEMERAIAEFNDRDSAHPMFGEFGYSASPQTSISLDRVSHSVDELFMEGDTMMATITVKETPLGNILKTLCEEAPSAIKLGPRGLGRVNEDGVIRDFELITVDIIQNTN